jgi:hypothetical protein
MNKIIDQLISEGYDIEKLETWHNKDNEEMMVNLDKGDDPCGGVPFLLNQKTGKTICGKVSYKKLKKWAEGE